jgi:hypothetical protein
MQEIHMINAAKVVLAAALILFSATAAAWWDNTSDWFGDAFGDFDFSFNIRFNAHGDAFTRDHGYGYYHHPYYGYGPYNPAPFSTPAQAPGATTPAVEPVSQKY